MLFDYELLLIDYMLRKQHKVDDQHHDMPLIYYMEGHNLHFGRREFSLITDFRFETVSFDLHSFDELKFRNRVFPNKIGFGIKSIDIIGVIEDEEMFGKLSGDDAIRLFLLLALEVIFMGRLLTFNVDDTLFSLVENIEAWNSFPWGEHLWCHLYDEIKNLKERHDDEHYYGLFKDCNYVLTYTLSGFVFAFQLEKARKRGKTGFMVSSIGGTTDNTVRKKWLNNLVITELNFRLFKLETIIQVLVHERSDRQAKLKFTDEFSSMTSDLCDSLNSMFADLIEPADLDEDISQDYLREEDLRMCLEGEEKMRCEHQKLIVEENRIRLDLLLQKGMPLFYANEERYTTPWSEADQLVRDTYVSCQQLMVRCEVRHEQILEMQNLVGSTVVVESVRLLQKFQQDDLESSRGMMRLIWKNLYADFLHPDCVDYHFYVLDHWSYEDVYGGVCFDVCGLFKGFDCIEEPVGCDDGSLPGISTSLLNFPAIKQLAIKQWDEYGFVIHPVNTAYAQLVLLVYKVTAVFNQVNAAKFKSFYCRMDKD
nr:phospholipase-like protein [Tanacetum cinerariifolium]